MTESTDDYQEIKTFEDIELFAEMVDGKIRVDFDKKGAESNAVLRLNSQGRPDIIMKDGSKLE